MQRDCVLLCNIEIRIKPHNQVIVIVMKMHSHFYPQHYIISCAHKINVYQLNNCI